MGIFLQESDEAAYTQLTARSLLILGGVSTHHLEVKGNGQASLCVVTAFRTQNMVMISLQIRWVTSLSVLFAPSSAANLRTALPQMGEQPHPACLEIISSPLLGSRWWRLTIGVGWWSFQRNPFSCFKVGQPPGSNLCSRAPCGMELN